MNSPPVSVNATSEELDAVFAAYPVGYLATLTHGDLMRLAAGAPVKEMDVAPLARGVEPPRKRQKTRHPDHPDPEPPLTIPWNSAAGAIFSPFS